MVDDANMYTSGMEAAKLAFETIRGALGMLKDAKDVMPKGDKSATVALAIEQSEKQFAIAEAQLAKALGYELCRCEFPPTIMVTVGTTIPRGNERSTQVYECPKCGTDTGYPYRFNRTTKLPNTRNP